MHKPWRSMQPGVDSSCMAPRMHVRQMLGLVPSVSLVVEPSPVVELNRAAAVAMRDGPEAGLALVDAILARGYLIDYHLTHSARADLCRRLGRIDDARGSYERALALAEQGPERRFLEKRLRELRQTEEAANSLRR